MEGENTTQAAPGCLPWLLIAAGLLLTLALFGVDDDGHNTHTNTNTYKAELLSRNQANMLSDVRNEFYDCSGPWSCTTIVTSTTSTSIDGDRNAVQQTGGLECYDATLKRYTPEACGGQP